MSSGSKGKSLAGKLKAAREMALSNTGLAALMLLFIAASAWSTLLFLNWPSPAASAPVAVTGFNTGTATVSFCVNTAPSLNLSNCTSQTNVSVQYNCTAVATDANAGTNFTFADNSTLFNINASSGAITFTPGATAAGSYDFLINVSDNSGCSNQGTSAVLQLAINGSCAGNSAPSLNLSSSFSVDRNSTLTIDINASDPDGDASNFSVAFKQTDAFASLSPVGGSYVTLDTSSGLLTIDPAAKHIGYHVLNISAQDNSTCPASTDYALVNITIVPANSRPFYITSAGSLNYTWNEDTNILNAYDLDLYFNDTDGDCLRYETHTISGSFVTVSIDNNNDPRNTSCPPSHFVSFTVSANQFGTQLVSFAANDTINVSDDVIVALTVNNQPESTGGGTAAAAGGGGGGGGGGRIKRCEEKWYCTGWSSCGGGWSARNCTDFNICSTSLYKPNVTRRCGASDFCSDGIQDYDEEGVDCGGSCGETCATCFDAILNCPRALNGTISCEEGVDCGGPCRPCAEGEIVRPTEVPKLAPPALYGNVEWGIVMGALSLVALLTLLFLLHRRTPLKQRITALSGGLVAFFRKRVAALRKLRLPPMLRWLSKIAGWLGRRPAGQAGAPVPVTAIKPHAPDIAARLALLASQTAKEEPASSLKQLDTIMKDWLKHHLSIDYEATYEELGGAAREKKLQDFMSKSVEPFFSKLTELEYSGGGVARKQVDALVREASKLAKLRPLRNKQGHRAVAVAMAMLLLFAGAALFFQGGLQGAPITGFLVKQNATFTVPVGQTFAYPASYELFAGERPLGRLAITGTLTPGAAVRVTAGGQLVFDSALSTWKQAPRVKTSQRKTLAPGERAIDLGLSYHAGTAWDPDDDGIEGSDGVIDLSVESSRFGWQADTSKACTIYTVDSGASREQACYGSAMCCALYDLAAERDAFDDTFFLSQGKLGASEANIVSAKIAYANYSVDPTDSYFEVIESEEEKISAIFEPPVLQVTDACEDTCKPVGPVSGTLAIDVQNGSFTLESVSYDSALTFNRAPSIRDLPNVTLDYGSSFQLRLRDYATDPDGDALSYSWYQVDGIDARFSDGDVTLSAQPGFSGTAYTFFIANDTDQAALSNLVSISVRKQLDVAVAGPIRVGEPVRWTKTATVRAATVGLDHVPLNFTVREITASGVRELERDRYALKQGPSRAVAAAAPAATAPAAELLVSTAAQEVEVEYYTEAPIAFEEEVSDSLKRVTVSSDLPYTNLTAFTTLPDVPQDAIRLYHLANGAREEAGFDAYDRNANGLTDYIEWQVPHLSNETYEIEISVLNLQSYPTVGGSWEVRFTTLGAANLTIEASNGTTYGLSGDLAPQELRCGSTLVSTTNASNSVSVADYACNETGSWTVAVQTAGSHHQRFSFGSAEAYAHNFASINSSGTNLSVYDNQDLDGLAKYSTSNIIFYANYTNGTEISGVCTIQFNLTGSFTGAANMTYNETGGKYEYNRTLPYKGTRYYNVLCQNATSPTLNVTDSALINNSAPSLNKTDGKLPALSCTEDIDCKYNISHYATDADLNDATTFDYTAGSIQNLTSHADCSNCWRFDFTNGNFTVSVTTSDLANTGPFRPIVTVSDTSDDSDSATIDITITAVNDLPVFSTPSGSSITNATTESNYSYQLAASDEESGSSLTYNFSILSCQQSYISDCSALTMTLNSSTGLINFTPVNNDAGNYTLNFTAKDGSNGTGYKLANFTITDINNAPVFNTTCTNTTAIEDIRHYCVINATDQDQDTLNFTANVSWFLFSRTSSSGVVANFTASNAEVGNYSVKLNVSDGILSATAIINFTVNNTNDAPWLYNLSAQTAVVGLNFTATLVAFDDDFWQPYNAFTAASENLTFALNQSFLTLNKTNATAARINFTPVSGQIGNYSILVNVSDIALSVGQMTFNLTVRNNSAPSLYTLCSNLTVIQEGAQFSCIFNVTDAEGDAFNFTANASWFNLSAAGNASLFPNDNRVGNHSLLITVTDIWTGAGTYIYNVTVNNTPEAPAFIVVPNLTATRASLFTYNLSANVSDDDLNLPTPDTLTFGDNSTLFNITSGGIINFTPASSDVGNYSVNITVNDSYGFTISAAVALEVVNFNTAPSFSYLCDNERTAQEDTLFTCIINATDLENDAVTFVANVSWFTIANTSVRGAVANFTANYTLVGNHSINVTARDYGLNTTQTINFTVNNTNDAPTLTLGNLNSTEDSLFNYTLNATDEDFSVPDNDTLTYRSNSTLFTVNSSTGQILFTPNSSQVGNYSFQFNVSDLANATAQANITFQVGFFNDPPVLSSVPNFEVEAGQQFTYDVNATDEEEGEANLSYRFNLSSPFAINSSGTMNFSVNSSFVGFYAVNLTVNDSSGKTNSTLFNLTILSVNSPPNLSQVRPYGAPLSSTTVFDWANASGFTLNRTAINVSENATVAFNITVSDPNGENVTIRWYIDGTLNSTRTDNISSFDYLPDFLEAGDHNVSVIVTDNRTANASFAWNVTVADFNRAPRFGLVDHEAGDFASGTKNGTNVTATGIILAANGSVYNNSGSYLSPAIDMGSAPSIVYNPIGLVNISWSAATPSGTAVGLRTRTSDDGSTWNNWSLAVLNRSYLNSSGEHIISANTTYLQYLVALNASNSSVTPNVTDVYITHLLPSITLDAGDSLPNWIDLDEYFSELDSDDTLNYTVSSTSSAVLSISNTTHVVSLTAPSGSSGIETVTFNATDGNASVLSNPVTITIEAVESVSATETVTVTRTRTSYKTRLRTQTEPRYLEVITPQHIQGYSEDTVVAPIILTNNGEATLNNIKLTANASDTTVTTWFERTSYDTLLPKQSERTQLFIKWSGTVKEFDIIVSAHSTDPDFTDKAVVSVTGTERVAENRTQIESHVQFVRDLLQMNPECLELSELMEDAQQDIQDGQYDRARERLSFVIEGCRYLLSTPREIEQLEPIKTRDSALFKILSSVLLLLLFIAMLIIIWLAKRRRVA